MIVRDFQSQDFVAVSEMNLRTWDQIEAMAAYGRGVSEGLEQSILSSSLVYVAEDGEGIQGVFGLNTDDKQIGVPWFVATKVAEDNKMLIARMGLKMVKEFLKERSWLMNYVACDHEQSIKWLEWLGFTVDKSTEIYLWSSEVPFWMFYLRRE